MASSLIIHKRITTTVAKAKELRKYVEPLITKSKTDSTHSRRVVFRYLQDKESVRELFDEVSEKTTNRPGGYTRIIKMGNRLGDNADMCIIELVDYNELLLEESKPAKTRTRRSRRGKKSDAAAAAEQPTAKEEKVKASAEDAVEDVTEEVPEENKEQTENKVEESTSAAPASEESKVEEDTSGEEVKAQAKEEEGDKTEDTPDEEEKEESKGDNKKE